MEPSSDYNDRDSRRYDTKRGGHNFRGGRLPRGSRGGGHGSHGYHQKSSYDERTRYVAYDPSNPQEVFEPKDPREQKQPNGFGMGQNYNSSSQGRREDWPQENRRDNQGSYRVQSDYKGGYDEKRERREPDSRRETPADGQRQSGDRRRLPRNSDDYRHPERRGDPHSHHVDQSRNQNYKKNYSGRGNGNENFEEEKEQRRDQKQFGGMKRSERVKEQLLKKEREERLEEAVDMAEIENMPIEEQFQKEKCMCIVCLRSIKKQDGLWSCKQCFVYLHLNCMTNWIMNSVVNKDPKATTKIWNCPHCNILYSEELPKDTCFCGKVTEPERDPYLTPHSCGRKCGKKRGPNCVHPCQELCHPGQCKPCFETGKAAVCRCGKKSFPTRCSENQTDFKCDQPCGLLFSCGEHKCQEVCHSGQCQQCPIEREWQCFCGKIKKIVNCGNRDFSCQSQCQKPLNCGQHSCQKPCHSGECGPCPLIPKMVQKCSCGKKLIKQIPNAVERKSCTDALVTCGSVCGKQLQCGNHQCKELCHELLECPKCLEVILKDCECGYEEVEVLCSESDKPVKCTKVCKAKKSCKQHRCEVVCCTAKPGNDPNGYHLCLKVCGKQLECGNHTCELFCHGKLPCDSCPIQTNIPLTCGCGRKQISPPIRCGTKLPECLEPCGKLLPCGHHCLATCHTGDCPNCMEVIEKPCFCDGTLVTSQCSKDAACMKKCKIQLACGHLCNLPCHKPGECRAECVQKCGKKRKNCPHKCMEACHKEEECPEVPCQVNVKAKCECGRRETFVPCGVVDVPLQPSLKCDESCKKMMRFGSLFQKSAQRTYYPGTLLKFCKTNLAYVEKLERNIENMILQGKESMELVLSRSDQAKKLFIQLLVSRHYQMDLEYWNTGNSINIVIKLNVHSKVPNPKLSTYFGQVQRGQVVCEVLPFDVTLRSPLTYTDQPEMIDNILYEIKDKYYLERAERSLSVHIWDRLDTEEVLKKLAKYGWNRFEIEENFKLIDEQNEIEAAKEDVVMTSKEAQGLKEEGKRDEEEPEEETKAEENDGEEKEKSKEADSDQQEQREVEETKDPI